MEDLLAREAVDSIRERGFAWVDSSFRSVTDAWCAAEDLANSCVEAEAPLEVIGEFVVPAIDGPPSRDFQTLHIDFGLPLRPETPTDVALFTALHVPAAAPAVAASTRLVPLVTLLKGRAWPDRAELVRRFDTYGDSHGAREGSRGYVEGSFARILEAALGRAPVLPSVRTHPEFLCGTEFAAIAEESSFFERLGFDLDAATVEITLRPGQLLVFDNLALAHGRRGTRMPGELHQRVLGHRALPASEQAKLRDRWLNAFSLDATLPASRR